MARTKAVVAKGVTLTWNSVAIAELTNIGGVEITTEGTDATHYNSDDGFDESLPSGFFAVGDIPIEGNFVYDDTTGQQAMLTDMLASTLRTAVITFPAATGCTWTFTGYITALKLADFPIKDKLPFTGTIKITGKPTFAVATSAGLTTPFFAISESAVITPDPAGDVYDYVANVLTGVSSVTITPTASAGTITVNGNTVTSGEASSAITLGAAGTNTTATIVVTETSKAPKTYTIRIARAAS